MMIGRIFTATIILAGFATTNQASAQPQSLDVCKALLAGGVQDTYQVMDKSYGYTLVKGATCSSTYDTIAKAKSAALAGGANIFDVIDVDFDGSSAEEEYRRKRSEFCESSYNSSTDNQFNNTNISRANTGLASQFNECARIVSANSGRVAGFVTPSSDMKVVSITVTKAAGSAFIKEFNSTPKLRSCTGGLLEATERSPVNIGNSQTFQCERENTEDSLVLSGKTTNDGDIFRGSIELPGTRETFRNILARLSAVEASSVRRGTIAYFDKKCPSDGWVEYTKLRGNYVVGVPLDGKIGEGKGTALGNLEERATGRHSHGYTKPVSRGTNSSGSSGYTTFRNVDPNSTRTTAHGEVEGTNAPYIQLMACQKT